MEAHVKSTFRNGIFLHFLDLYHQHVARLLNGYPARLVASEATLAFRLGFLFSERVYLSASAYLESRFTRTLLQNHAPICEAGFVLTTGRDSTFGDHFERKKEVQYSNTNSPELKAAYMSPPPSWLLYRSADIRTARAIRSSWFRELEKERLPAISGQSHLKRLENAWSRVPEVLGESAFVLPHVVSSFNKLGVLAPTDINLLKVLDPAYTLSHAIPLGCGIIYDLNYLQTPWLAPRVPHSISYRSLRDLLIRHDLLDLVNGADGDFLLRLRLSREWESMANLLFAADFDDTTELRDCVSDVRSLFSARYPSMKQNIAVTQSYHIGVVTALPEEWTATTNALNAQEIESVPGDPNRYAYAQLTHHELAGTVEVIVTFLPRMNTTAASVVSTNLLRSFPKVQSIIFSGIACGCPFPNNASKHVRLGDIVVSDLRGIVQLDHQSLTETNSNNRSQLPPPSRQLLNAVRLLQSDAIGGVHPWEPLLSGLEAQNSHFRRPKGRTDLLLDPAGARVRHPRDRERRSNKPKIVNGVIGSWNTLLRNHTVRDRIANDYNLRAIEMEGAGTAEAVWHFGKEYLIVRGVCDYGDDRTKNDIWHAYAAAAAAAYTAVLLKRLLGSPINATAIDLMPS